MYGSTIMHLSRDNVSNEHGLALPSLCLVITIVASVLFCKDCMFSARFFTTALFAVCRPIELYIKGVILVWLCVLLVLYMLYALNYNSCKASAVASRSSSKDGFANSHTATDRGRSMCQQVRTRIPGYALVQFAASPGSEGLSATVVPMVRIQWKLLD